MIATNGIPVLGFAAPSGTGKTTLLKQLVPLLRTRGLRLGLIKHSHHPFSVDHPGKDSDVLSRAGAVQTVIASARRTVTLSRQAKDGSLGLNNLLERLHGESLDLILVEGFKQAPIPKIELYRAALARPLFCCEDPAIIAVASDVVLDIPSLPVLNLNNAAEIADFIMTSRLA
jgi:molybdopterin-guanine dinucleotide biosynthesis protein MobB